MPTMNVNLTADLYEFVTEQLGEGYANQSEVIREALRVMKDQRNQLRDLKAALAEADEDIAAGRTDELTDQLIEQIAAEGMAAALARRKANA